MKPDQQHASPLIVASHCTLEGFEQVGPILRLTLAGDCSHVQAVALNDVPPVVSTGTLADAHYLVTSFHAASTELQAIVDIQLSALHERLDREYSVLLYIGNTAKGKFIELIRQNEKWLEDTFGFSRNGGYTLLGRRSGCLIGGNPPPLHDPTPVLFVGPSNERRRGVGKSELEHARQVTLQMYRRPIGAGPSNRRHLLYSLLTPETQLKKIRKAKPPIQCTGFRDVWLGLMAKRGFHVRAVEANDEVMISPDLVTFGHSCAEIWVSKSRSWMLYDPWFGGLTLSLDGEFLDASTLSELVARGSCELERIKLSYDVEKVERFVKQADGSRYEFAVRPNSIDVLEPTSGALGTQPPYSIYFNHVTLRRVQNVSPTKKILISVRSRISSTARGALSKRLGKRHTQSKSGSS